MKKEAFQIASVEARKKLDDQLATIRFADQKIGMLLGFVGIIFMLFFNKEPEGWLSILSYTIGLLVLVSSVLILFFGFRSVRLKTGLSIKGFSELFKKINSENDITTFIEHQLLYLEEAVKSNNGLIKQKLEYLAYGTLTLLAGVLFYIISYLI